MRKPLFVRIALVAVVLVMLSCGLAAAQADAPASPENPLAPYLGSLGFLALYAGQVGMFVGVLSWLVTEGLVAFATALPREKVAPLVALGLGIAAHASGQIVAPGAWDGYLWAAAISFVAGGMGARLFANTIGNWFLSGKHNDIAYSEPSTKR